MEGEATEREPKQDREEMYKSVTDRYKAAAPSSTSRHSNLTGVPASKQQLRRE